MPHCQGPSRQHVHLPFNCCAQFGNDPETYEAQLGERLVQWQHANEKRSSPNNWPRGSTNAKALALAAWVLYARRYNYAWTKLWCSGINVEADLKRFVVLVQEVRRRLPTCKTAKIWGFSANGFAYAARRAHVYHGSMCAVSMLMLACMHG